MTGRTEVQKGVTLHVQINVLNGLINFSFQNALQNNFFVVFANDIHLWKWFTGAVSSMIFDNSSMYIILKATHHFLI